MIRPLNTPTVEVLMQIQGDPYFKLSEPLNSNPDQCGKDKYCRFHRDHGHDIEDWFDL